MSPEQSRQLKIGHMAANKKSDDIPGTVISVNHAGVKIKWSSGKVTGYRHDDMAHIKAAK